MMVSCSRDADLLKKQMAELTEKHDKIADMKASYDCDETVDGSCLRCIQH